VVPLSLGHHGHPLPALFVGLGHAPP